MADSAIGLFLQKLNFRERPVEEVLSPKNEYSYALNPFPQASLRIEYLVRFRGALLTVIIDSEKRSLSENVLNNLKGTTLFKSEHICIISSGRLTEKKVVEKIDFLHRASRLRDKVIREIKETVERYSPRPQRRKPATTAGRN